MDDETHTSTPQPPSPDRIIDNLKDLINANDDEKDATLLQIRASSLFSQLKALNRAATVATRQSKDTTAASRQEMDQSNLGLQNLQFEKRHLQKEIEKCLQFASVYQDIPLYDLEVFQKLAPKAAKTPDVLADEHQLMLNRLSFELAERQRLDQRKKELVAAKEELLKSSKSKLATLDNVKLQIDMLVKTAADIQKKVDELVQPASTPKPDVPMSGPN